MEWVELEGPSFADYIEYCLLNFVNSLNPDRAKIFVNIWIHIVGHSSRFPERYILKTIISIENSAEDNNDIKSGADPGFLEMGAICIKVWGFALLILSHFSQISHENEFIWSH